MLRDQLRSSSRIIDVIISRRNSVAVSESVFAEFAQTLIGALVFRGVGAPAVKSTEFTLVSLHPLLARRTAFVLLGAGVGPLPSKQFAVEP